MDDNCTSPSLKIIKPEEVDEDNECVDKGHSSEKERASDTKSLSADGVEDEDTCPVCLQHLLDRTVIPECSHEFCFDCILTWTNQSRRCPLCTRTIGPYIIHHIRSNFDYQKYHLHPLRTSPPPIVPLRRSQGTSANTSQRQPQERWGRHERRDSEDELDRAIQKRKWVYRNNIFAKHVASNTITRHRPLPSPAQFAASADHVRKATIFIRRELHVWTSLDIEFLTTFIISMMRAIDLRSESSVKLVAEFLDMGVGYYPGRRFPNAEHFIHELSCFLRSPYKNLAAWDANVQYDIPYGYEGTNIDRHYEPRERGTRNEDTRRSHRIAMTGMDSARRRDSSVHLSESLSNHDQTIESSASPSPCSRPWNHMTVTVVSEVEDNLDVQSNHVESGESRNDLTPPSTAISLLRPMKATDVALFNSEGEQPESETDRKGKQRQVSSERSAGVTTTSSPDDVPRDNKLDGTEPKITTSNNASDRKHTRKIGSDQDADNRPRPAVFHNSTRIRSSLQIAQAHLSRSDTSTSASDNLSKYNYPGRKREIPQLNSNPPSLLARLTDVPTKELLEDSPSSRDKYTVFSPDRPPKEEPILKEAVVERPDVARDSQSIMLASVGGERALAKAEMATNTETSTMGMSAKSAQLNAPLSGMQDTSTDTRKRLLAKLAAVKETYLRETLSRGERRGGLTK